MRFTLINNLQKESVMSLVLKGFLVFTLLYLVSDILVMNSTFGTSVESVHTTLYGDVDEYIDPMNEASFLEFWHTQIFFMMMTVLTLSAIFIRVSEKSKIVLINILMISAITSLISLAFAFYMSDIFISAYVLTFFIWHALAVYMSICSFWKLNAKSV